MTTKTRGYLSPYEVANKANMVTWHALIGHGNKLPNVIPSWGCSRLFDFEVVRYKDIIQGTFKSLNVMSEVGRGGIS